MEVITGPVTAAHVHHHHTASVIHGCGPYLVVQSPLGRRTIKVLKVGTVSGIVPLGASVTSKDGVGHDDHIDDDLELLLCYGGKELCIVTTDGTILMHRFIRDRIWTAKALPACRFTGSLPGKDADDNDDDGSSAATIAFAFVLAHNSFHVWAGRTPQTVSECHHFVGDIACLLYSAAILPLAEGCVFASGTIFQQVRLAYWPYPAIHAKAASEEQSTLASAAVLDGHNGVIFNVSFSPDGTHVLTLSDDRSARVWNLTISDLIEGSRDIASSPDRPTVITPSLTLYGHASRVWVGIILEETIVTAGEDGVVCVWDYAGNRLQRFRGHIGRGIWSGAVFDRAHVVTGGGDGAVWKWCVSLEALQQEEKKVHGEWVPQLDGTAQDQSSSPSSPAPSPTSSSLHTLSQPPSDIQETAARNSRTSAVREVDPQGDMPAVCCLLDQETLFMVSKLGVVSTYSMTSRTERLLFKNNALLKRAELARTKGRVSATGSSSSMGSTSALVAITSTRGLVYLCNKTGALGVFRAHLVQVRSLMWLSEEEEIESNAPSSVYHLLTCAAGELRLWRVKVSLSQLTSSSSQPSSEEARGASDGVEGAVDVHLVAQVNTDTGMFVQCGTFLGTGYDSFAVGDRKGFVHVFSTATAAHATLPYTAVAAGAERVAVHNAWVEEREDDIRIQGIAGDEALWERIVAEAAESSQQQTQLTPEAEERKASAKTQKAKTQKQVRSGLLVKHASSTPQSPCFTFKAHGRQSVTSLASFFAADGSGERLLSTGRNGYYCTFTVNSVLAPTDDNEGTSEADVSFPLALSLVGKKRVSNKMDWLHHVSLVQHHQSPTIANNNVVEETIPDSDGAMERSDVLLQVDPVSPVSAAIGFIRKDFIVLDALTGQEVVKLNVGGGHRSWDFLSTAECREVVVDSADTSDDVSTFHDQGLQHAFAFIRNGAVHWQRYDNRVCAQGSDEDVEGCQPASKKLLASEEEVAVGEQRRNVLRECLLPGFHGREVITMARLSKHVEGRVVLFCGSEDTTWSVSSVSADSKIVKHNRVHGHVSAVRALAVSEWPPQPKASSSAEATGASILFSGGGSGTVIAWQLTPFAKAANELAFSAHAMCKWPPPRNGVDAGSRVMGLSIKPTAAQDEKDDDNPSAAVELAIALSDGTIRFTRFVEKRFVDYAVTANLSKCVLLCEWLPSSTSPLLVSAATDGVVSFWDDGQGNCKQPNSAEEVGTALEPVFQVSAHQSGVNTLCVLRDLSGDAASSEPVPYYLVTGGDDNAVCLTTVSVRRDGCEVEGTLAQVEVVVVHQHTIPSAHSAAVTASASVGGSMLVATSGADCRVNLWRISKAHELQLVSSVVAGVHDVHHLTLIREAPIVVAVAGKGLELLTLSEEGDEEEDKSAA